MLIEVGFDIAVSVAQPTLMTTLLDVHPSRRIDVVHEAPLVIGSGVGQPNIEVAARADRFGNVCRRLQLQPGRTDLRYRATITDSGQHEPKIPDTVEPALHELTTELLPYLSPSRYSDSDKIAGFAWNMFGAVPAGGARLRAVLDFVHRHIRFDYQCASSTRSASEALAERVGVCRDFAHLTIALCRALNMPSRYVNGYLGDIGVPKVPYPMDFSAWCEVWIGGRWMTVDARHNQPRIGRVVIARGMDATDVAMLTTFGPHLLERFEVVSDVVAPRSTKQQLHSRSSMAA